MQIERYISYSEASEESEIGYLAALESRCDPSPSWRAFCKQYACVEMLLVIALEANQI